MKLCILLLMTLYLPSAMAADCLKVVPYKALGELQMGALPPDNFPFATEPKEQGGWEVGGGYRFRRNAKGRIDYIQRELRNGECYEIQGRRYKGENPDLQKLFPKCRFSPGLGAGTLLCNGFEILQGKTLRIDVSHHDLAGDQKQKTKDLVNRETEKFPWIKKTPYTW